MKALAIILPALAAATPLKARDDAATLWLCTEWLNCPLNYECVYSDASCTKNCKGYCYPDGSGLPTATLSTTNIATATLPTGTGLPTTNVVGRAAEPTMFPRTKMSKPFTPRQEDEEEEEGTVTLEPLPYDEETIKIWGDKLFKYEPCGGFRPDPVPVCPEGTTCISAPWGPECGLACDGPGICVDPVMCGGIAGFKCPNEDDICIDYPGDGCDPKNGGADCAGVCI